MCTCCRKRFLTFVKYSRVFRRFCRVISAIAELRVVIPYSYRRPYGARPLFGSDGQHDRRRSGHGNPSEDRRNAHPCPHRPPSPDQSCRASVEQGAGEAGVVGVEGDVGQCEGAEVGDAAADAGRVAGDRDVAERRRAFVEQAAAEDGGVAGDGHVGNGQKYRGC